MARHKQQKYLIAFYDTYLLFKLLCIFMILYLFTFHHTCPRVFFYKTYSHLKTLSYFLQDLSLFYDDTCFCNTFLLFMILVFKILSYFS